MKDIIVLGMGPSRVDCPYDDGAEIWGVNNGYHLTPGYYRERDRIKLAELEKIIEVAPEPQKSEARFEFENLKNLLDLPPGRIDKLFICHRGQEWDSQGDPIFHFDELNSMVEQGKLEIFTLFNVKEIKKYTRIPYRAMYKRFGTHYFSDSIAWMIAYALYLNTYKHNGVLKLREPMRMRMYGVDMHTKDEYATERGGIEYFIATARAIGADFWIHPGSSVCKNSSGVPYGFFHLKPKEVDPVSILKLQTSERGLRRMHKMGVINEAEMFDMIKVLKGVTTS